eukprot:gnl/TRDRNA2_/TRDRNA2_127043_c0_seq1.p1 gnl/TRDRNA2_/TRDRNA2_127043_c0~~gnl/TRDRNA2_/TRDRNA2_127043_c0_seq1.p1  ORF type:complete len:413 (+),score=49.44 gnl/TRDRNA2_/TRDRNA2_127043_c0_seq1:84-1322(+)
MFIQETVLLLACLAWAGATRGFSVSTQSRRGVKSLEQHTRLSWVFNPARSFQHPRLRTVSLRYLPYSRPSVWYTAKPGPWLMRSMPAVMSMQDSFAAGDRRPAGTYSFLKAQGFECTEDGCTWEEQETADGQSLVDREKTATADAETRLALAKTEEERAAAEAEVRRSKAVLELAQDADGRLLFFAARIRGGLLHLDADQLKTLRPALADVIYKDAAHAAATAYGDPLRYSERVMDLALAEPDSQQWAGTKAKELLASHGYKTLRRDLIFGPYIRAAERISVDQVSFEHNQHRTHRLVAQMGLLAASKLWNSPLPLPGKKRMADVAVTEALELMSAEYSSKAFVEMADRSLLDYRLAKLNAAGLEVELKCPWPFVLVHAPIGGLKQHPAKTAILAAFIAWYGWRLGWLRWLI